MGGKARVRELVKELGVTSKEILARLAADGEFVTSASSTIKAPVAARLRAAYGYTRPGPKSVAVEARRRAAGTTPTQPKAAADKRARRAPLPPPRPSTSAGVFDLPPLRRIPTRRLTSYLGNVKPGTGLRSQGCAK
ncbi:translation initiation factor IF-2 N-terminal domain-containing protein [Mycobacterium vicinigordonae]|uniref:Translation initiation factor IF-2 N-terminal domain-containing protein n=1 Tax=Mycobacterium vicinigordonae TaxID=1719132 RepID=A0A7D6I7C5_9MYCO|nr:translation initiation factor IF-2 N-terminal domain-containing protein [Mycobacterium vicinigordonae]